MARPVVLFDEDCGICTAIAQGLRRANRFSLAAIGSSTGAALLRDLTVPERYAAFHVVDEHGRRSSGGAAIPALLRALPAGGPIAWAAERCPSLTDRAYRALAARRSTLSRLAGRSARSCRETGSQASFSRTS